MVCIQDPICNLLCCICFDNTKSVVCPMDYADGNWLHSWQGEDKKVWPSLAPQKLSRDDNQ